MKTFSQVETKVQVIFQMAEGYVLGKMTLEQARETLNPEMKRLRPIEMNALKAHLVSALSGTEPDSNHTKRIQLLSTYFPPAYSELPKPHPVHHYYLENTALREVLLRADYLLEENGKNEDWLSVYEGYLPYRQHIKRQRVNLYPKLKPLLNESQFELILQLSDKLEVDLEHMGSRIEAGINLDFLLEQQNWIKTVTDYLDIEEKVLYWVLLKNFSKESLYALRQEDDGFGYAYIESDHLLDWTEVNGFIKEHVEHCPLSEKSLVNALMASEPMGIFLYSEMGSLVYTKNSALEGQNSLEEQSRLEEPVVQWFFQKEPSNLKATVVEKNSKWLVGYSRVLKEDSAGYYILKTKQPYKEDYPDLAELIESVKRSAQVISVEDDRSIKEILEAYPKLRVTFFDIDHQLKGLREDPMGAYLIQNATIKMLSTALEIAPVQLVGKMNEILKR